MNDNSLIDSNVLIYAYDQSDKEKHQKAKKLLSACWERKAFFFISSQNLAEFFVIVTSKIKPALSTNEAESIIKDIINFSQWRIISYNEDTILNAIKLHKKHFWDSLIVATMLENSVFTIYTENMSDFAQFEKKN